MDGIQRLKQGYAHLLDVPVEYLGRPGFTLVKTARREAPEWANWVMPVWLMSIGAGVVCSVSPQLADRANEVFGALKIEALLTPQLLEEAYRLIDAEGWRQREVYFYPRQQPPTVRTLHQVQGLRSGDRYAERFLSTFDGGVRVILDQGGEIASYAGIKNKGLINEIAVGTEPTYQRREMGKAVVTEAVTHILRKGKVPVFVPSTVTNTASYALARSLGFEKAGEMLFWEYELSDWQGFSSG